MMRSSPAYIGCRRYRYGPEVRSAAHPGNASGAGGIVVAFDGGGAWFTPNLGGSWLPRNGAGGEGVDAHIHRLYRHPDLPGRLYAVTRTGLYRSTDEGHSWLQSLKDLDRSWGGSLAVLPGPTDTLVLSLAKSAEGAGALAVGWEAVCMNTSAT